MIFVRRPTIVLNEVVATGKDRGIYNLLDVTIVPHYSGQSYHKITPPLWVFSNLWHPDKWTRTPSLLGEAKKKFQQIQEAYSVLSDEKKRMMYDAGLYDPEEDEDEGFADFLQEMTSLMKDARKEDKSYTMEELQSMFWDMAQGFETCNWSSFSQQQNFESPQWFCSSSMAYDDSRTSRTAPLDANFRNPLFGFSTMEMHGAYRFCR